MPQTVALVTQGDFSVLLTDNADGSSRLDSIQVLSEYLLYNYDAVTRLVHTATQATGIKKTAFILLDRATADDGVSCCIAIDAREDDESAPLLGFRCEFGSIEPALKAIERGVPVKELRDQSFMAGGLWRKDVVEDRLTRSSSLNMSDFFPAHKDWKPAFTDDVSLHFPVFRTAEVSIKVCWPRPNWEIADQVMINMNTDSEQLSGASLRSWVGSSGWSAGCFHYQTQRPLHWRPCGGTAEISSRTTRDAVRCQAERMRCSRS